MLLLYKRVIFFVEFCIIDNKGLYLNHLYLFSEFRFNQEFHEIPFTANKTVIE